MAGGVPRGSERKGSSMSVRKVIVCDAPDCGVERPGQDGASSVGWWSFECECMVPMCGVSTGTMTAYYYRHACPKHRDVVLASIIKEAERDRLAGERDQEELRRMS